MMTYAQALADLKDYSNAIVELRAEIERLHLQVDALNRALCRSGDERLQQADEIERLRRDHHAEVERLLVVIDRKQAEIERLQASALAWKLIAKHKVRWNALPQSEKEATLNKALEGEVEDGCRKDVEIERLKADIQTLFENNERLTADNVKLRAEWRPEKNSLVEERLLDEAKVKLTEAAAFLDGMADKLFKRHVADTSGYALDCRAMATKLKNSA